MEFKSINFRKISPAELVTLHKNGDLKLNKAERKLLETQIQASVSGGIYQVALNSIILGQLLPKPDTMDMIRRKGLFRYSHYINRKCIVSELVKAMLEILGPYGLLDKRTETYLQSVQTLAYLHREYGRLHTEIINEFKYFHKNYVGFSLLKTLIVHADYLFLHLVVPPPDKKGDMNSIFSRSKEEVSSATSYLIYELTTVIPSSVLKGSKVSDKYIINRDIYRLLLPAALIEDYKEIELLVEHYGYRVTKNGSEYRLEPPTPNFERDMRFGFIRTQTQAMNTGMSFMRWAEKGEELLSIAKIVETFIKIENFIKFEFVPGLYPRYRIGLPDFAYQILHEKLFDKETLFKDEAYHFAWITGEQLLDLDSLKAVKISENLRLIDFLKIKRYFLFMHMVYEYKFKDVKELNEAHLLHSLTPQLNQEQLDFMLKGFDKAMIDEFMDVVCWEPGDDHLFDLQYQPITYINEQYVIPFNILAQMNVVRNLYASEYRKNNQFLVLDGSNDPLSNKLSKTLTKAGIENHTGLVYGEGDIDVIALFDNTLFFIECKHSLHPGDLYELRRTYDYVKKAERQLDRALDHYHHKKLMRNIEAVFGRPLTTTVKEVRTLIVTSNRILSGNNFTHPVRDINDLVNFIVRGTFVTNEGVFSLYKGEKFTLPEFIDYIENDNPALNHMRDTLIKYDQVYKTPNETLTYETYFVEMEPALEALKGFTEGIRKVRDHIDEGY